MTLAALYRPCCVQMFCLAFPLLTLTEMLHSILIDMLDGL